MYQTAADPSLAFDQRFSAKITMWLRKHALPWILVLAFAARGLLLVATWRSHNAIVGDSRSYLVPATSLAADMTFRSLGLPEIFRTPGYPLFLFVCWVNGPFGFGIAQIVQVLFSVATVYLTFRLAEQVASRPAALWAAGLQALSVVSVAVCPLIVTECLYTFLFLATFYLLVRHLRDGGNPWCLAGAALLAAMATYVKPVGMIWIPIVVLVLLGRPGRLRNAAVFMTLFVVSVAPWYLRNASETGYRGFSTVGDFNWLFYEAAGVWAKIHGMSIVEAQNDLNLRYRQQVVARHLQSSPASSKQGAFDVNAERNPSAIALEREMANGIILPHFPLFARVHLLSSLGSLLPASNLVLEMLDVTSGATGTLSVLQQQGAVAAWNHYFRANGRAALLLMPEFILMAVQYGGLLLFVFHTLRNRARPSAVIALFVMTSAAFLLIGGPASTARMRLPVEPLLNIGAAGGFVWLLNRHKQAGSADRKPTTK
jgi:4-amino-4-deoxy-L-arabinose transferase-like glycosyltransferase